MECGASSRVNVTALWNIVFRPSGGNEVDECDDDGGAHDDCDERSEDRGQCYDVILIMHGTRKSLILMTVQMAVTPKLARIEYLDLMRYWEHPRTRHC